jgi:farnesyl-diphosphate farnesyltransferase
MADLDALLISTSRTFALAIPHLPEPTCREVTIAYLLFRIADTFEDATAWTQAQQAAALDGFCRVLDPDSTLDPEALAAEWLAHPPLENEDYLELLRETPAVLSALRGLRPGAQRVIRHHVRRTAEGMSDIASREQGIQLQSIEELTEYCYIVAGIVGEMLTELFLLGRDQLAEARPYLHDRARCFGEGLQLTNILKDSAGDAVEGRRFVPTDEDRPQIFALAREDLRRAEEYVRALEEHGAEPGILAFNAIPVLLAWRTLDLVETHGPGSKLRREEVGDLVRRVHHALQHGEPVMDPVAER